MQLIRNTVPMDQQSPADSAWQTFFKGCFSRRISSSNLPELIPQFEATARPRPLAPERLARALLDAGSNGQQTDPRLPSYLETLLDTKRITVVDLLVAIAQFRDPSDLTSTSLDTANTLHFTVFRLLIQRIANDTIDNDNLLLTLLGQLLPWMSQHPASATVGLLVSASLGSPAAEHAMTTAVTKKFKASFARRLTPLVNNLSSTNIQLASALSYYQKQYDLQGEAFAGNSIDILNGVDLAALSFNDTVMDNEAVTTRAGLYIYLNTLVRLQ